MKIEFRVEEYWWAHMQAPRGRGWWWFRLHGGGKDPTTFTSPPETLYVQAKKLAAAKARELGHSLVVVCP